MEIAIIPEGFDIKTVSVTKKADGYYVTLSLDDKTVPTIKPDLNAENIVGVDVGLIDSYVASDNTRIAAPKHLRKAERKLQSAQQACACKGNPLATFKAAEWMNVDD